jgi:filamentous hemagglutinin family protein
MNDSCYTVCTVLALAISLGPGSIPAIAQIQPQAGTTVNPVGNRLDITGTQVSGKNQFHNFQTFNVNSGQTANFIPNNATIQNILSRVTGGTPSQIQGVIQSANGVNLFLMNPSGILFGNGASLNVNGSFTATTANAIGFGNNLWFNAAGNNNTSTLTGDPTQFAFTSNNPGAIVNTGTLTLPANQSLNLIGGTVINTGTIGTPGGNITIAAVEGGKAVQISAPGSILSYTLPIESINAINPAIGSPVSLPELLSGTTSSNATGIEVKDGIVRLTRSQTQIPSQPGTAVVTNTINVSGEKGGKIGIFGKTVGVIDSTLEASGTSGGGNIRVGGDYQGSGSAPNATTTVVDRTSKFRVNAIDRGNAGEAVIWSDGTTRYAGSIEAKGGVQGGNGGSVEVSGRQKLSFTGSVDVSAAKGNSGTLLLDPDEIRIVNGNGGANDTEIADGSILSTDGGTGIFTISETALEALAGNVTLEATNKITIEDLNDNKLILSASSFTFKTTGSNGIIESIDPNDKISFNGGPLNISASTLKLGNLEQSSGSSNQVAIKLTATNDIQVADIDAQGAIEISTSAGNIKAGAISSSNFQIPTKLTATTGNIEVNSIKAGILGAGLLTDIVLDVFAGKTVRVIGSRSNSFDFSLKNADDQTFNFLATKTVKTVDEVKASLPSGTNPRLSIPTPVSILVNGGSLRIRYAGGGGIERTVSEGVTLQGGDNRFEIGAKSTPGNGDPYTPLNNSDTFNTFITTPFSIVKNTIYTPIVISEGASGTVGAIVRATVTDGSLSVGTQDLAFGILPTKPNPKPDPKPDTKIPTIDLETRNTAKLATCPQTQTIASAQIEPTRSPTDPKALKNPCKPDDNDDEILKILK